MSQHYTARQLASYGRGPDTELVHMSKKEIKGLQDLAMAHGGSLTINPTTGLAEAGFLSKILPMIAGGALMMIPGVNALAAGAIVGGGVGLAKGSLKEGLMAGLSAYGGAGLASGLAAAGTSAAVDTAGTAAVDQATTAAATEAAKATAGQQIATDAAKEALLNNPTGLPSNYADLAAQTASPNQIGQIQAQNYLTANQGNLSAETLKGLQSAVPNAQNPLDIVRSAGQANASLAPNVVNPTAGQFVSNMGQGIKTLATNPSQLTGFASNNVGALTSLALPALEGNQKSNIPAGYQPDEYDRRLGKYRLADDYKAYEAPQPNPYYRAQYPSYAEGGITGLAMGGVSNMPPQTNFANPQVSDMGTSQYSMATDPMSGNIANRMAEGGVTGGGEMQLNVPISIGGGGGGNSGFGGSGGYGGYSSGAGYAPPGGPQGGSAGSLASLLKGAQQGQSPAGAAPQAQGAQAAQSAQLNMQDNAQAQQGMSADVNGFTPIQTNQGTLLAGQFLQGLSGVPQDQQKANGAMFNSQYGMQQDQSPIQMASGGIARFAGRSSSQVIQDYLDRQQKTDAYLPESVGVPRVGIARDTDIETYKKPALEASIIRLGKTYGAAGIKPAKLPKTSIKGLGDVSGATPDTTEAASGGTMHSHLGGYSDGGRMLKGPGDGMSDDIPATISGKQPARLADGEFVVPADVVSHLGNGSTDAGAKKLYSMMAKIRKARTGKKKQAPAVKADRFMPA
jgi:hypothetical protein